MLGHRRLYQGKSSAVRSESVATVRPCLSSSARGAANKTAKCVMHSVGTAPRVGLFLANVLPKHCLAVAFAPKFTNFGAVRCQARPKAGVGVAFPPKLAKP